MSTGVEIVCDPDDGCGEAPLWIDALSTLMWADQARGCIRCLDTSPPGWRVVATGFAAGGMNLTADGALVLTGPEGAARLKAGASLERLPLCGTDGPVSLNDACAGADGELLAGIMHLTPDAGAVRAPGALVCVRPDGAVRPLDPELMLPNGMSLSPDRTRLYVVDSARRCVLTYSVASLRAGQLDRRVLIAFAPRDGVPDGLAVDAAGNLWVALWYGGAIVQVSAHGRILQRVAMPFPQVSSLAFGGSDGRDLFITTAASAWHSVFAPPGWRAGPNRQGGPLLRLRTTVPGARRARLRWP